MVKKEPWIPPYDEWAKEAELTWWFGRWRNPNSQLGFDFLYEDGEPRFEYEKSDDWQEQDFPVNFESEWAKGRKPWEVWLDAYDAWDHETRRLAEVYARLTEAMDAEEAGEYCAGRFPWPPPMPDKMQRLFKHAGTQDIIKLAQIIEDPDIEVNCKDQNLQTPLMFAAIGGSLDCVEYLVDMGADPNPEDNCGDTAFDFAISQWGDRYPDHPIIMYFKNLGAARGHGVRSKLMPYLGEITIEEVEEEEEGEEGPKIEEVEPEE